MDLLQTNSEKIVNCSESSNEGLHVKENIKYKPDFKSFCIVHIIFSINAMCTVQNVQLRI